MPLVVIAAGLLAYQNSWRGPFIFDDVPHIVDNPRIRQLWPPWEAFSHSSRPVVQLSLALNYAIGGLDTTGYHAVNLAIHLMAALVLFGIVRRTLCSFPVALAGSLLWVVHPLQTQSVTYIIQRSESLMGLFYLLTLYCVIRGASEPTARPWYVTAVIFCAAGMATKPVMITAPLIVLLYDRAFLSTSFADALRRRWGLYCGLAATWGVLAGLLVPAPDDWRPSAGFALQGVSPLQYALTQPAVIAHYLWLSVWPSRLCLDYGWQFAENWSEVVPYATFVLLLLAATVWALWRKPALSFLGAWFFLILSPTSSFVPVADAAMEHRMYLPLAAVVVAGVVGAHEVLSALNSRMGLSEPTARWVEGTVLGVAVVLLGLTTIRRNDDYRSAVSIWQDTVAKRPDNERARNSFGLALMNEGNLEEAIGQFSESVRLKPRYAQAHNNLGIALARLGRNTEALDRLSRAVELDPAYVDARVNLGNVLAGQGQLQQAVEQYRAALQQMPHHPDAHNNLGVALFKLDKVPEAIREYTEALRLRPVWAEPHYNLGNALAREDRLEEAVSHFEKAVRLRPDYAEAHAKLALALSLMNKTAEAVRHYREALRLRPDWPEVSTELASILATHPDPGVLHDKAAP
jgi:tetratricopeptide (TPR) repeat protein